MDKKVAIASMTKMVAQIIILEEIENNKIKWDDVVTASRNASGMSQIQVFSLYAPVWSTEWRWRPFPEPQHLSLPW